MATRPTTTPPYFETQSVVAASTRIRMIASGMPVRMLREKYHQCGRRSSATVSPSWIRLLGVRHAEPTAALGRTPSRARRAARRTCRSSDRPRAARSPAPARESSASSRELRQRTAEDRDAVGRDTRVPERPALRERHAFVEPEQRAAGPSRPVARRRPVLDHHRDVVHLGRRARAGSRRARRRPSARTALVRDVDHRSEGTATDSEIPLNRRARPYDAEAGEHGPVPDATRPSGLRRIRKTDGRGSGAVTEPNGTTPGR